ncbi:putative MFS monocarboxylate transporter [Nemania sp. NC0429]|nr:putative MFS monocarboxylate transporter [Nemania sp. NC0429]
MEPKPLDSTQGLTRKQWLQIVSTFIVFLNTWGLLLTFGVFQTSYAEFLLKDRSTSEISWISTTCAFFILSTGFITGPLYDLGFYRPLVVFGSLLEVVGLMVLSLSTQYYQLFLSQALAIGIGAGVIFTPSVAAAAACISSPAIRARCMGLVAAGSSIGGIIYPIMFRYLVHQIGFPWTVRSIGFIPRKPAVARGLVDVSAYTDWPFVVLFIASIFSSTAYYIPFLYLPLYTQMKVPSVTSGSAFDLLAILNGSSAIGRILAGLAAALIGPTETICVSLIDTFAGTIVWAVFWGIISGVLVALPGAIIPLLCPTPSVIGTRTGMYWVSVGIGLLIGSPIGGAIDNFRSTDPSSPRLQIFAGIFMLAASLFTVYLLVYLRRKAAVRSPRG